MARMWRNNSGNPVTVHKFKINTDKIYSLLWDYKTLFISVFSLDFVFLLYRFRFFPLDFVFLLYRFRFISFSYFTDFVGFCFRFVSFLFVSQFTGTLNQDVFVSIVTSKLPQDVLLQLEIQKGSTAKWPIKGLCERLLGYVNARERSERNHVPT